MSKEFVPKLFSLLKEGIPRKVLVKDLFAGIIVGIVALPLAIAFAIASGVSPEIGLVTAVVAGLTISIFGGSRVQIGGPTGAFIVLVFSTVTEHGMDGLIIATVMAGIFMIGFGLARLGNYLKFVPYPLIVGFTAGIAVIIFSSQINDFLGLEIRDVPADFIGKWQVYFREFDQINPYALGIGLTTVLMTVYSHRFIKLIPGSLIAILFFGLLTWLFEFPVATIGSVYGDLPNTISIPAFPEFDLAKIQSLIQPAVAIALLGAIESLLSAVVADGMIGGRHRSNMELVAQGGANVLSGIFGGIPATGAIARTATNVKNGGRTPVAGITHAIVLLIILVVFGPYAKLIPLSCLAGVLVVVAYNMSEWRQFKSILKSRNADILILLTTFFLTVIFDLVIAIEVGLVLSGFLLMKRMSESLSVKQKNLFAEVDRPEEIINGGYDYPSDKVVLFEVNGPLFFGAAQQFQDTIFDTNVRPEYIIIRMRYVPFIDTTGYLRLKEIIKVFNDKGIIVVLSGVSEDLLRDMQANFVFDLIDEGMVFGHFDDALQWVKSEVESEGRAGGKRPGHIKKN
ncbi:MAG TPA: SulP family inorganic anion transporter [Cryomorphaceae bacterium]|nr:SulP family inorganic anion transporter [Cryomorphaceae bacterium]